MRRLVAISVLFTSALLAQTNRGSISGTVTDATGAVVPGAAFRSPEWIRVSYAAPADQVTEGVRRIIAARIS